MVRIDRYIAKYFLGYFLGGLLVFLTVFLAIDVLSTFVSYKGVAPQFLIEYYLLYIPDVIQKLIPVSCLLATILCLSTLNKSNELVALFAAGYSLFRIALPIIIIVFGFSVFSFYLSDRIIPTLTRQKNYIFYHEIKKNPSQFSIVKTNRIWYRSKNEIFNIKTLSLDGTTAHGLTLYTFDDAWDLQRMITAEEVDLRNKSIKDASGHYQWFLKKGTVTVFYKDNSFPLLPILKKKPS